MKKNIIIRLLSVVLVIVLVSCNDDSDDAVTEYDIYGSVSLYDEFGYKTDDHSMFVTAVNSGPGISGITDVIGVYVIKNVPFGTYKLVFEKEGFGTYVMNNIKHEDNGYPTRIPVIPLLSERSTTAVKIVTVETSGDTIFISMFVDPDAELLKDRYVRLFFDEQSSVSDSVYKDYTDKITVNKVPFTQEFLKDHFYEMGFEPGQKVWFKVYGDSYYSNSYYNDDSVKVFPNLNHDTPPALSFELP